MTTISYHHDSKTIACDSRVSSGDVIESDTFEKWIHIENGDIMFLAGSLGDLEKFSQEFLPYKESEVYLNAVGYIVEKESNKVYRCGMHYDTKKFWKAPVNYSHASGSGMDHALTALDLGKTAKEALELAAKRDCKTGGKIHVYDIKRGEFVNE